VQDRKRKLGGRSGGGLLLAAATASVLALIFAGSGAAGVPGGNGCRADGQIAGAGATLQTRAQVAWIQGYTNDVCGFLSGSSFTNSPANTNVLYNNINDNSQSSWAFTGSGTGQKLTNCRAVPFGGSDIPYDNATLTQLNGDPGNILGGSTQGATQAHCTGSTSGGPPAQPDISTLLNPFYAGTAGAYPFTTGSAATSDQQTNVMSYPVTSTAVMVGIFFGVSGTDSHGCPASPQLTGAQLSDIFGGIDTHWDQVFPGCFAGSAGTTQLPIRRVVRVDKSGTTQNFKNYLAAVNGGGAQCNGQTWSTLAQDANNVNWPTGGACPVNLVRGASATNLSGNKGVFDTCVGINSPGAGDPNDPGPVPGSVCYGDLPDYKNGPASYATITEAQLPSGVGGVMQTPENGHRANCDLSGITTPNSDSTGAVGLAPGDTWSLNNAGGVHANLGNQGVGWPICAVTWDLVYTGLSTASGTTAGNPIQNLNNDMRRTEYNYMLYVLKDGQSVVTGLYYQNLPQSLLNQEIAGFKANY
jgi:ABC-type phosphate transport system substrate-binding protein